MSDLATLVAKDQIADCIHGLFSGTDARAWDRVRRCLADRVRLDMTSLRGGTPQDLTAAQVTDGWAAGLRNLEHVHHQVGNLQIQVQQDTATAFCNGIAFHYRTTASGENVQRFVGSYDIGLTRADSRWTITAFRFNVKFVDGNMDLDTAP
jgi:hypothetical protein